MNNDTQRLQVVEFIDRDIRFRAYQIGEGHNDELGSYIVVQPLQALLSGEWFSWPTDDTAFKISAGQVVYRD